MKKRIQRKAFPSGRFRLVFSVIFILSCIFPLSAHAEPKSYLVPEGKASSLMIFEQAGFARVYGIFTRGLARFHYDGQLKTVDGLKVALLAESFTTASPSLKADIMGKAPPNKESEVAFVQTEAARFDNGKARIKGDLIINNIRKKAVFQADLNRAGRVSRTTNVMEEGQETAGLSLHVNFKRSDYAMSAQAATSPFNDEAVLMIDLIGVRQQ